MQEKLKFMIEEMCMTGLNFRQISFVYRKLGSVIYQICAGWIRYPDKGHIENSIIQVVKTPSSLLSSIPSSANWDERDDLKHAQISERVSFLSPPLCNPRQLVVFYNVLSASKYIMHWIV